MVHPAKRRSWLKRRRSSASSTLDDEPTGPVATDDTDQDVTGSAPPEILKVTETAASSPPPPSPAETQITDTIMTTEKPVVTAHSATTTTTPRKRGRPPKRARTTTETPTTPLKADHLGGSDDKKSDDAVILTPLKAVGPHASTPGRNAADRSARRKAARTLLEHAASGTAAGGGDDQEGDGDDEEDLARAIFGDTSDEEDDDDEEEEEEEEAEDEAEEGLSNDGGGDKPNKVDTPNTRKRKRPEKEEDGKRTRRRRAAKSPTPPRDLPAHETYFFHNKPGRPKTSDNTLAGLRLLTHEEYFDILGRDSDDDDDNNVHARPPASLTRRHKKETDSLESLHAESFAQWVFELSQGFSLCLYGLGSKRPLLARLAAHLRDLVPASPIVVVNGHAPTANVREILSCIATAVGLAGTSGVGTSADKSSLKKKKMMTTTTTATTPGAQPLATVQAILAHLSSNEDRSLILIIHSIDASALRQRGSSSASSSSSAQAVLARLAAHPAVHLVCSADGPDFPLLWDCAARAALNFAFHDGTTLAALDVDVVDEVHALLGRGAGARGGRGGRAGGRDAVVFVLRSLPANARSLFRLLVGEVLLAMDEGGDDAGEEEEERGAVEYRIMYNKAVEEFVCSSEMAFRTLLKEFHDHQIITSRKDLLGTELLSLPFEREELEAILEDLTE